ncbi:hypothetical protein Nepgr_022607 [Nepenthes gracilis]|uniref:RRM domain-containing protein n=1 Tax=Nepenthes gracilis TaxID=150966 RepID=A0AAD3SZX4_NEPGR|nr:hypothetical protein Nepgr_022607 [Nepenthes gracilis]
MRLDKQLSTSTDYDKKLTIIGKISAHWNPRGTRLKKGEWGSPPIRLSDSGGWTAELQRICTKTSVTMNPVAEEQLDYGDEEYRGPGKMLHQGVGAIPALADEELMGEEDEYEDLYNDVNVGEGFSQLHQPEPLGFPKTVGDGVLQVQKFNVHEPRREAGASQDIGNPWAAVDEKYGSTQPSLPEQKGGFTAVPGPERKPNSQIDGPLVSPKGPRDTSAGSMAFQGPTSTPQKTGFHAIDNHKAAGGLGVVLEMQSNQMTMNTNANVIRPVLNDNFIRPPVENGSTMLFVGELHWWTTDEELERVLTRYGRVKEIKFFDERASGKSKGYCQVEFYDHTAAAACKEGMNGHMFNGRACIVTVASPQTLRQMGAAYMNKTQTQPPSVQNQGRRNMNDGARRGAGGMNFQGGDMGRNYGRGGVGGRGGQGILNRGPGGGPQGRGPMAPKNSVGISLGVGSGPAFGGPVGGMMHPQAAMGPGIDPTFMGRGAGYGGFLGPFPWMMPPFPAVNTMGFAAVAPHVNPAFFGRGMPPNGMGVAGNNGVEGHPGGMWPDTSMSGWGGEEHGRRIREPSYGGDDGASDYGYSEENTEKGARSNAISREKDRASEHRWSGNSERKHRDEREQEWDRSDREQQHGEEKDSYHRHKDHVVGYEDDQRSRSRSRAVTEHYHRSQSRDLDYGKRRRAPSE